MKRIELQDRLGYDLTECGHGYLKVEPILPKLHQCKTPGWWARLLFGVKSNNIWICGKCHQEWEWQQNPDYLEYLRNNTTTNCPPSDKMMWVKK